MKKVGIIFAMGEELEALKKNLVISKEYTIFDLTFYEGMNNNITYVLVECGIGKVNAARTTQILIDNMKVDYIFNIGVAGGVSNILDVGDVVISDNLVQHDFDITAFNHEKGYIPNVGTYIKADEYLVKLIEDVMGECNLKYYVGTIASGDIFCTERKMSEKIASKFKALCVEMEGASVAQICFLAHIPFVILRSISDIPNNNNVITYEEFLQSSCDVIAMVMNKVINKIGDNN